ncbi:MAG: hypothetical protein DWQ05_17870 [Calditrichaeota bacterium]|nr:MAG: hypothetical protein DWQ05_17870 [Calditrichota bacterium]
MNKKYLLSGLVVVILFQICVLGGEYLNAVYPLWTGQEIKLRIVPVDPRSPFRGNYLRLRYGISTIAKSELGQIERPRNNEIIYISLQPGHDGFYEFAAASLDIPQDRLFIRGRIQNPRWRKDVPEYTVFFGIEAWFASEEKVDALDKELRRNGVAVVVVAKNGKAALKNVYAE